MPFLDSWQMADKVRSASYLIRSLGIEFTPEQIEPAHTMLLMVDHVLVGQPDRRALHAKLNTAIEALDTCTWDRPHDVPVGGFVDDEQRDELTSNLLLIAAALEGWR